VPWSAAAARARSQSAHLDTLTRITINEMLDAFGLGGVRRGRGLLEAFCYKRAHEFAQQAATYDAVVGTAGLQTGGLWVLDTFVRHVEIIGQDLVPREGPVLLVANHPGLFDAPALFGATPRPDLRVVAAERPFLEALPNTTRYLFVVPEQAEQRFKPVRAVARHLRQGGAVLTFPRGEIEPDPAILPDAPASLRNWSGSVEHFVRLAPDMTIVPTVVSGVLAPWALRHPLTWLRRSERERRWLAATLQFIRTTMQDIRLRVAFGTPIQTAALASNADPAAISQAVLREMERLLHEAQR
jgi:1-acyl-sn-glycerol-3-phosphate acyltransferase